MGVNTTRGDRVRTGAATGAAIDQYDLMQLGQSIVDYRSWAMARAKALSIFASPPSVFEDDFTQPPGTNPSKFRFAQLTGVGAAISELETERGGVSRLASGGVLNSQVIANVGTAANAITGMVDDPFVSGTRWYLLWVFRIPTTPDTHAFNLLWIANDGQSQALYFGADGAFISTTKLGAEDNVNATLSSVDISPGTWHYLEAWQTGQVADLKKVFFRYDNEATKTLTVGAGFGTKGTLTLQAANGTTLAAQQLDTDHIVLLMDNNVTLPMPT